MDDFRTPGDGSFSLGSRTWPGLSKLVEECGEVLQIAGKIMGTGGAVQLDRDHWHCHCGNDLFQATQDGMYCPNCGEWQHGF